MELCSVSEYSKLTGKDPGNIRRLLIKDELPGMKIGKQWVIEKETPYPEDGRIRKGQYKNWRKRWMIYKRYPELMKNLTKMSKEIAEVYGDCILEVIMFGSYSRCEETEESDVDIAIIIDKGAENEAMHDKMTDIVVDYELEVGKTLSVITIENASLAVWSGALPFYKNLQKDGIILWKAA